jgi:hypothetical protein
MPPDFIPIFDVDTRREAAVLIAFIGFAAVVLMRQFFDGTFR